MTDTKKTSYKIIKEIFNALTAAIAIFFVLELIWPGMAIAYLNLNIMLIFWLISSIILMFASKPEEKQ